MYVRGCAAVTDDGDEGTDYSYTGVLVKCGAASFLWLNKVKLIFCFCFGVRSKHVSVYFLVDGLLVKHDQSVCSLRWFEINSKPEVLPGKCTTLSLSTPGRPY